MDFEHRSVRIKICGITRFEDALAAIDAGAHALGFVFHSGSPRFVRTEQAASIIKSLPPFVQTVGVFVNRSREEIVRTAISTGINVIQLHGDERPEDCEGYNLPVIKAVRLEHNGSLSEVKLFRTQGVLVEANVDGQWGGTGVPLDWETLSNRLREDGSSLGDGLVLAGGLNPSNVANAVKIVRPYAVDVSTGVEDMPGIKNHRKIRDFISEVHSISFQKGAIKICP
jgi:phosphoribosylanthranilate isomerase